MKKFEDLDLTQVDWSKYEKQLNRIDTRLNKVKKNEKMMLRLNIAYLEKEKEDLIKYLEDKIKENQKLACESKDRYIQDIYLAKLKAYQDISEKIKEW